MTQPRAVSLVQRVPWLVVALALVAPLALAQPATPFTIARPAPDFDVIGPAELTFDAQGRARAEYTVVNKLNLTEALRFTLTARDGTEGGAAARFTPEVVMLAPNASATFVMEVVAWDPATPPTGPLLLTAFGPGGAPAEQYEIAIRTDDAALPTTALVAFLVTAGGLVAAVAAWRRLEWLRYAALAALPLYTRLAPDRLLEQERREALHRLIQDEPGINFSTLLRRSGLPNGVLVHHLRQLERHRLVVSRRDGALRRFATAAAEFPAPAPKPLTPTQQRVLDMLLDAPRTQREIAEALGVSQQGANRHVKALERRGLLAIRYEEGEWRCHAVATTAPLQS